MFWRGKIYYIRIAGPNGKVHAEHFGPSKAPALEVCQKRKTQAAVRRCSPGANVSVAELMKDAIPDAERNHALQRAKKRTSYRYRLLAEWFQGCQALSIRPEEIHNKLSDHRHTTANLNRYRNSVSHAYQLGIQNGKVNTNPAGLVKLKQENNTRVRFLEPEEELKLRDAIRDPHPAREAEFDLALNTGRRWSEQHSLTWSQVNWKRSEITLLHPKSDRKQYVRINKAARPAVERLRAITRGSEYLCPDQGYNVHRCSWDSVLKASKVTSFHWHDLRHTFASHLVMAGADINTVSELPRHGHVATTQRRAHLTDAQLQESLECLGGVTPSIIVFQRPSLLAPQSIQ